MITAAKPIKPLRRSPEISQGNGAPADSVNTKAETELSTAEVAENLHISLAFLTKALEAGEIPYRTVSGQRCIRYGDVQDYRERQRAEREEALRELALYSEEIGLYEIEDQLHTEPK